MNRYSFALFIALLIHLLVILIFWILSILIDVDKKPTNIEEEKIKISLKELPKKAKETKLKEVIKPKENKILPMPKGSQLKKIVKKTPPKPKIKSKKKEIKKEPKKIKPKPIKKPYVPLLPETKQIVNKTEPKPKTKDPMAWLYEDKSSQERKIKKIKTTSTSSINQNINELYGSKFGELTKAQQEYILDNQEIMRRITQRVLTRVANVNLKGNINVNTSNIVEFYLHPNGNMSDFKFLHKTDYFVLDDTTKETIEYAYSQYPRPKEKTLIRYNVFYNLRY